MSFDDDDRDPDKPGTSDEYGAISQLVKHARYVVNTQVNSPTDLIQFVAAIFNFLRAVAVIIDIGETEISDALSHYEKKGVPADERNKRRPAKVTAPLRGTASLIRIGAKHAEKTIPNYRRNYAGVGKARERSTTRTATGRPRTKTFNPNA